MDLKTYLRGMSPERREGFARHCGTTLAFMKAIAYGAKPCSPGLAVAIDRETSGAVSYRELCSEAKIDWTYIETKAYGSASSLAASSLSVQSMQLGDGERK